MYPGFLAIDGMEIANIERTIAYATRFVPTLTINDCDRCVGLHNAVGDNEYVSPQADGAPWVRLHDPATSKFYGLYPTAVSGVDDSTSQTLVAELIGDGATHSRIRHGSKEIRVRGLLIAQDVDGLEAGGRWLRSVLDALPCQRAYNCTGHELTFFSNCPGGPTSAAALEHVEQYRRTMYRIDVVDGLREIRRFPLQAGAMAEVEFVLNAGIPWAFTDLVQSVTLTGLVGTPVNEVACPPWTDAYDNLVLDPQDTAHPRPPRPPVVSAVAMPSNWTRYQAVIPARNGERWGRLTPVVRVYTDDVPTRLLRVRFYRDPNGLPGIDVPACDWDGEFLVTYMPPHSIMRIDGILREITLSVAGGPFYPAPNLVLGSNGRPPTWPNMACETPYLVVIDSYRTLDSGDWLLVETAVGA